MILAPLSRRTHVPFPNGLPRSFDSSACPLSVNAEPDRLLAPPLFQASTTILLGITADALPLVSTQGDFDLSRILFFFLVRVEKLGYPILLL